MMHSQPGKNVTWVTSLYIVYNCSSKGTGIMSQHNVLKIPGHNAVMHMKYINTPVQWRN